MHRQLHCHMTIPPQAACLCPLSSHQPRPGQKTDEGPVPPSEPNRNSAASGTELGKATELNPSNLGGPVSTLLDEQETPPQEEEVRTALVGCLHRLWQPTLLPSNPTRQRFERALLYIVNTRLHSTALGVARKVVARGRLLFPCPASFQVDPLGLNIRPVLPVIL